MWENRRASKRKKFTKTKKIHQKKKNSPEEIF
jgi:hypothetical protein